MKPTSDKTAKTPMNGFNHLGTDSTQAPSLKLGDGGRLRRRISTVASSRTERAGRFELYCTGTVWPSRPRRNSCASSSEPQLRLYFPPNVSPESVYEYARTASQVRERLDCSVSPRKR